MWWLIGGAIVFSALFVYSICKSAGDADREMERLFKEEVKLDRKEVM